MENLHHRMKILEKIYNVDADRIQNLEEQLREERIRRKKLEVFVKKETEMRKELEESLKKEVGQREALETWISHFIENVKCQYDVLEQSGADSANARGDTNGVDEDVSDEKNDPNITDDTEAANGFADDMETTDVRDGEDGDDPETEELNEASADSPATTESEGQIRKAKKASASKTTQGKPFECPLCDRKCSSDNKLKAHMDRRHEKPEPAEQRKPPNASNNTNLAQCEYCSKVFASRASMKKHTLVHPAAQAVTFRCPIAQCSRYYSREINFYTHLKDCHEESQFAFSCVPCGEKFGDNMDAYVSHVDYHRGAVETSAEEVTSEL